MLDQLDQLLAVADEVPSWPTQQQEWYVATVDRLMTLRSPADFATANSSGLWLPYRHLRFTSDAIVDMIENDTCDGLIIDQPVRHGKSELCSRWTPAWYVCRYPNRRVLLATYQSEFAEDFGRRVREYVVEHGPEYGVSMSPISKAAARWDLAHPHTGGMNTAGSGGSITGKGGHLMIVDDPVKNDEEANSQVMRDKLWEWWDQTWLTRSEPGAKYIVIMSRWHEDDLIGRLIDQDTKRRWKRLRMPAVAEEDDILGREVGEPLCPERYDLDALATIRNDQPISWPALYQQRPVQQGGGMFQRDKIRKFWKQRVGGRDYYVVDGEYHLVEDCRVFATMDTAYTKNLRSDFTCLGVFVTFPGDPPSFGLLHMYRERTNHAEHGPMVMQAWTDYPDITYVGIEHISATLALFDEVQRNGVVTRQLKPDKNKVARAEAAVSLAEQGRFYVLRGKSWIEEFLGELTAFPKGRHDDQVDVLAYAAREIIQRQIAAHRRRRDPITVEERLAAHRKRKAKEKKRGPGHPVLGKW